MSSQAPASTGRLSLRFISGKYQGGEFPLPQRGEIFVGRSSELDMVLVEDMVSRRHAVIRVDGANLEVEDLGSTNGSFVNGERVQKALLSEGDRLLIGTSIIRIVRGSENAEMVDSTAEGQPQLEAKATTSKNKAMTGSIAEVPIPDLLQLFGTAKKTGTLSIRTDIDLGKLHLEEGRIIHASLNGNDDIEALKCAYRIITWKDGIFEMGRPEPIDASVERLDLTTEAVLMEALHQSDELARLEPDMPPRSAHLTLAVPLIAPLRSLSPQELDVVQLAHNYGHVETVMNHAEGSDLEIATIIVKLLRESYFRID